MATSETGQGNECDRSYTDELARHHYSWIVAISDRVVKGVPVSKALSLKGVPVWKQNRPAVRLS